MKIVFVIPSVQLYGGIRLVLEVSDRLVDMGHEVKLVYPVDLTSTPRGRVERMKDRVRIARYRMNRYPREVIDWHDCAADVVKVPTMDHKFMPDADVVVATSWETAEAVAQYPPSKGLKTYLIQGDESVWSQYPERAMETYRKNWCAITISTFLKERLYDSYGLDCEGPLVCGVNHQQFKDVGGRNNGRIRIGTLFSPWWLKGFKDGLKAVDEVVRRGADVELLAFGRDYVEKYSSYEFPCRTILNFFPEQSRMCELYSSCDIWMSSSRFEGGGPMPSQEAAACGCAVVTTDVGAMKDCFEHGKSALISPPSEPVLLADNLMRLIRDPSLRSNIASHGKARIADFTWQRFAEGFIEILNNRVPGKGTKKGSRSVFKRGSVRSDTDSQRGRETSSVH